MAGGREGGRVSTHDNGKFDVSERSELTRRGEERTVKGLGSREGGREGGRGELLLL